MGLQIRGRPSPAARQLYSSPEGRFLHEVRQSGSIIDTEDTAADILFAPSSLPVLATASDAREFVRYVRRRPNGVTVIEAMNAEPRRIFDARKVAAYEFWGIIVRENERLMLTDLGRELAEAIDPECRINRRILNAVPAYRIALDRIFEEGQDIATHPDVIRMWSDLRTISGYNSERPQDLEAAVVCFFSICHAAELGTSTVGKRGQPARLRVDLEQLGEFLSASGPDPAREQKNVIPDALPGPSATSHDLHFRIMLSSSRPIEGLPILSSLLKLAGFEGVIEEQVDRESGLLPCTELNGMQQCHAAIFVIGPDDCIRQKDGTYLLRHDWITRISVASALFDWRIVVFWQGPPPPPEQLSESGLNVVSGELLDWEACMSIASMIKATV